MLCTAEHRYIELRCVLHGPDTYIYMVYCIALCTAWHTAPFPSWIYCCISEICAHCWCPSLCSSGAVSEKVNDCRCNLSNGSIFTSGTWRCLFESRNADGADALSFCRHAVLVEVSSSRVDADQDLPESTEWTLLVLLNTWSVFLGVRGGWLDFTRTTIYIGAHINLC